MTRHKLYRHVCHEVNHATQTMRKLLLACAQNRTLSAVELHAVGPDPIVYTIPHRAMKNQKIPVKIVTYQVSDVAFQVKMSNDFNHLAKTNPFQSLT